MRYSYLQGLVADDPLLAKELAMLQNWEQRCPPADRLLDSRASAQMKGPGGALNAVAAIQALQVRVL